MGSMLCLHYIGRAPHATHKQLAAYCIFLSLSLALSFLYSDKAWEK
jgi:hypothetical protein